MAIRRNGAALTAIVVAGVAGVAAVSAFLAQRRLRQRDDEDREANDAPSMEQEMVKSSSRGNCCSMKDESYGAFLPGLSRIFFHHQGCSHNRSSSEVMIGLLSAAGYTLVESMASSDICIFNSCTVKSPTEGALLSAVSRAKEAGKYIVICGCVPQAQRNLKGIREFSLIGVDRIDEVVFVVEETLRGNVVRALKPKSLPSLALPKIRRNRFIEVIPISSGCLGSCTYCQTRAARGSLRSYRPEAILRAARTAIAEGVSEIWLTSEDTGAYGRDSNTNIADLLELLCHELEAQSKERRRHIMMRIGMTNPPFILSLVDRVTKVLRHANVFEFLHLPVQSGSNSVLVDMKRDYTVEDFRSLVHRIREDVPNSTIATDIICGFPTETDEDHRETLQLLEECKLPAVNISQFYSRVGTPAAVMKQLNSKVVKSRSRSVTEFFESYQCFDYLVGTKQMVWFSETSTRSEHTVGHTKQYVQVLVPRNDSLLGTCEMCDIHSAHKWHVIGRLLGIEDAALPNPLLHGVTRNSSDDDSALDDEEEENEETCGY